MRTIRRYRIPLLVLVGFGVVGGFFYFQTNRETFQYASASYLANGSLVGIYAQRGELQKALQIIDTLQKEHPDDPAIYYNAALIYRSMKDIPAAIEVLQAGMVFVQDGQTQQWYQDLLTELSQ